MSDLDLISTTQQILHRVEELTKKKFKFVEKNDLPCFAKVKPARSKIDHHIIFYKKSHDEIINHLIAHECGHIIRIFSAPKQKRVVPFTNENHFKNAIVEFKDEMKKFPLSIPKLHMDQIMKMWFNGLISQLTNAPPDLMIEKWIYDTYKELRDYQLESIKRQWKDAIAGMNTEIKRITPSRIFNSSHIMNCTFYQIISDYLKYDFIRPYNSTPFMEDGKRLAELTQKNYNNTLDGDVEKINEWANFLNLSKWFGWTNFENVPKDYGCTLD
jgi:hypothetical protein